MRKTIIGLVGAIAALCAVAPAHAQDWGPGKYMQQALVEVLSSVKVINDKTDFGYDSGDICLLGALFPKKTSLTFERTLKGGEEYAFVAGGDEDASDVDVEILNSDGKVVAEDTDNDASAVVKYKPSRDGRYKMKVTLYDGSDAKSFIVVAFLRNGGYSVPTSNLATAAGGVLDTAKRASEKFKCDFPSGRWSLYGSLLNSGSSLTINGLSLESDSTYAFFGAGDTQAKDIDLAVETTGGSKLGEDTDDDARPAVLVKGKGDTARLKIMNKQSGSISLTIVGVLRFYGER